MFSSAERGRHHQLVAAPGTECSDILYACVIPLLMGLIHLTLLAAAPPAPWPGREMRRPSLKGVHGLHAPCAQRKGRALIAPRQAACLCPPGRVRGGSASCGVALRLHWPPLPDSNRPCAGRMDCWLRGWQSGESDGYTFK